MFCGESGLRVRPCFLGTRALKMRVPKTLWRMKSWRNGKTNATTSSIKHSIVTEKRRAVGSPDITRADELMHGGVQFELQCFPAAAAAHRRQSSPR